MNIKDFKVADFVRKYTKVIDRVTDKKSMKDYGEEALKDIIKISRAGRITLKDGEKTSKLPKLSADYIEQRKKTKKANKLSNATSPRKSNLTYSGDLLNRGLEVKAKDGQFTIEPKYFYKGQVKGLAEKLNRPFLHLPKSTLVKIIKDMKLRIKQLIGK